MKKAVVLGIVASLVIGSVVRFELIAQEPSDREPADGAEARGREAAEPAQGEAPEQLDRRQIFLGENFFVAPVTTPLQRLRLGKHRNRDAVAYANVNAKSLIVPGTGLIDSQGVAFTELRRALRQIAEDRTDGQLRILVNYGNTPPSEAAQDVERLLRETFDGMARAAGFSDVWVYGSWWTRQDYVWQPLELTAQDETAAEENAGTELVQVYPVRTSLSRYFTSGADCYLRFDSPPLKRWDDEYLDTISQAIDQLELTERRKARVQVFIPDPEKSNFEFPTDKVVQVLKEKDFQEIVVGIQKEATNVTSTYRSE